MTDDRSAKRALPQTGGAAARRSNSRVGSKKVSSRALATLSVFALLAAGGITLAVSPNANAVAVPTSQIKFNSDFQNISEPGKTLSGYQDSNGNVLSADAAWNGSQGGACNGLLVLGTYNGDAAGLNRCTAPEMAPEAAVASNAASYYGMQKLSRALQKFVNSKDETNISVTENNALASFTQGANAAAGETLIFGTSDTGIPVKPQRYYSLHADFAAYCDVAAPRIELWLDGKRVSDSVDVCSPGNNPLVQSAGYAGGPDSGVNPTDHDVLLKAGGEQASAYNARAVKVVRISSPALLTEKEALRVEVRNANVGSAGNEGALDNVRLVDVTPTVSSTFSAPEAKVGAPVSLQYQVMNNGGTTAKLGWKFTDTLPKGLASVPNAQPEIACFDDAGAPVGTASNIAATIDPVTGAVSVSGDLPDGTARCEIKLSVTSQAAGDFSTVTEALKGNLQNDVKPATVTFVKTDAAAPTDTGSTSPAVSPAPSSSATSATVSPAPSSSATSPAVSPAPSTTPAPSASGTPTASAAPTASATPSASGTPTASATPTTEAPSSPSSSPASAPAVKPLTTATVAPQPVRTSNSNLVAPATVSGQPSIAKMSSDVSPESVVLTAPADATDVAGDQKAYTDAVTKVRYSVVPETGDIAATPPAGYTGDIPTVKYTGLTRDGVAFGGTAAFPVESAPIVFNRAFAAQAVAETTTTFPTPAGIDRTSMNLINANNQLVKSLTIAGEAVYKVQADGSVTATREPGFTGVLESVQYSASGTNGALINGFASFSSTDTKEYARPVNSGAVATFQANRSVTWSSIKLVPFADAKSTSNDGKQFTSADDVVYSVHPDTGTVTATPPASRMGPIVPVNYAANINGSGTVDGMIYWPIENYDLNANPQDPGVTATVASPTGVNPKSTRLIDPNSGALVTTFTDVVTRVTYAVNTDTGVITAAPADKQVTTIPAVKYASKSSDGTQATGTVRFTVSGSETIAPVVSAGSNSVAPNPEGAFGSSLRLINPTTGARVRSYQDPASKILYYVDPAGSGQIFTQLPNGYRGLTPSIDYSVMSGGLFLTRGTAKFPTNNVDSLAPVSPVGTPGTAPLVAFAEPLSIKFVVPEGATNIGSDGRSFTSAAGVAYAVLPDGRVTASPPKDFKRVIDAVAYTGTSAKNSDFSGNVRFPASGADFEAPHGNVSATRSTTALFPGLLPSSLRMIDPITGKLGTGPYSSNDGGVIYKVDTAAGAFSVEPQPNYNLPAPAIKYGATTADGTAVSGVVRFPVQNYDVNSGPTTGSVPSTINLPRVLLPSTIKIAASGGDFYSDATFASEINAPEGLKYVADSKAGSVTVTPIGDYNGPRARVAYLGYTADGTRVLGWANFPIVERRFTASKVDMGQPAYAGPGQDLDPSSLVFQVPTGVFSPDGGKSYTDPVTNIKYSFDETGRVVATPPPGYVGAVPSAIFNGTQSNTGQVLPTIALFPNNDLQIRASQPDPMSPVTSPAMLGISGDGLKFSIPEGATDVTPNQRGYSIVGNTGSVIRYVLNADGSVTATPPADNVGALPTARVLTTTPDGAVTVSANVIFNVADAFVFAPVVAAGAEATAPKLSGANASSMKLIPRSGATDIAADGRSFKDGVTGIVYTVQGDGSITATPPEGYLDAIPPVAFTANSEGDGAQSNISGMVMFHVNDVQTYAPAAPSGTASSAPAPKYVKPGSVVLDVAEGAGGKLSADKRTYLSPHDVTYTISPEGNITATPGPAFKGHIEPIGYRAQQPGLSSNPNYWSEVLGKAVFPVSGANWLAKPSPVGQPSSPIVVESIDTSSVRLLDPQTNNAVLQYIDPATNIAYAVGDKGAIVATPPADFYGIIPAAAYSANFKDGLTGITGLAGFGVSNLDLAARPAAGDTVGVVTPPKFLDPKTLTFVDADNKPIGVVPVEPAPAEGAAPAKDAAPAEDAAPKATGSKTIALYVDPATKIEYKITADGVVSAKPPTGYEGAVPSISYQGLTDEGAQVLGRFTFPRSGYEVTAPPTALGAAATTAVVERVDLASKTLSLIDPVTNNMVDDYTDEDSKIAYRVNTNGTITATPPAGFQGAIPAAQFQGTAKDGTRVTGVARFPVKGLLITGPGVTKGLPQTATMFKEIDPASVQLLLPEGVKSAADGNRKYTSADGNVSYQVLPNGSVTATPLNGFDGALPGANWMAISGDGTLIYGVAQFPLTSSVVKCESRKPGVPGTVDINQRFEGMNVQPTTTVLVDPATSKPTTARTVSSVDGKVTYSLNNTGIITATTKTAGDPVAPISFLVYNAENTPYTGIADFTANQECALLYRVYENRTAVGPSDLTTLVAWNLAAKGKYSLYFMSDPVLVTQFTADAKGLAKVIAKIPANSPAGLHHWVIRDAKGALVGSLPVQLLTADTLPVGILPVGVTLPGMVQDTPATTNAVVANVNDAQPVPQQAIVQIPGTYVAGEYVPGRVRLTVPGSLAATGADGTDGIIIAGMALLLGGYLVAAGRRFRRQD